MVFVIVAVVFVLGLTFLPFAPGRYDAIAAPVSTICQFLGTASVLFVPIGLLWAAAVSSSRFAGTRRPFAIAALVIATLVLAVTSLVALAIGGNIVGVGCAVASFFGIARLARRVRSVDDAPVGTVRALAWALLVVPILVAGLQWSLLPAAIESSRSRAIRNSATLIADIEQYRATHGRYPLSLQGLWPDYLPDVTGIRQYHYEPSGDGYNLFFEQPSWHFGTQEIVMYNPRDEHGFVSHAMDRLRLTREQLPRGRGYYAVHDTTHLHWKSFLFD